MFLESILNETNIILVRGHHFPQHAVTSYYFRTLFDFKPAFLVELTFFVVIHLEVTAF